MAYFLTDNKNVCLFNLQNFISNLYKLNFIAYSQLNVLSRNKKVNLYSISADPVTGNQVCVGGLDRFVRIYDRRKMTSGNEFKKLSPHHFEVSSVYVTCALFNYNGTEILASYNDDDIYLFDCIHGNNTEFVHKYEGHRNSETVKGVNFFGPKSQYVISGSDCGNIFIWDKNTEAIVQLMEGDEEGVINCLECHPHIPILATSGLDVDVKIWVPSREQEPPMKNLWKVVASNQRRRELRVPAASRGTYTNTLLAIWSRLSSGGRMRGRASNSALQLVGAETTSDSDVENLQNAFSD